MFQYNLANTGHSSEGTGPSDSITEHWTYDTGTDMTSSASVVDSTVYIGSNDQTVYALTEE
jgi:outer membrane protein assembly factor BamB